MAILATVETIFGEERELYIRLNNLSASNHGQKTNALFRGFLSKQSFDDGKHYVYETSVEFDADVSKPLWQQAYDELAKKESFKTKEV